MESISNACTKIISNMVKYHSRQQAKINAIATETLMQKTNPISYYHDKVNLYADKRTIPLICTGWLASASLVMLLLIGVPFAMQGDTQVFVMTIIAAASTGLLSIAGGIGFGLKMLRDDSQLKNELKQAFPNAKNLVSIDGWQSALNDAWYKTERAEQEAEIGEPDV